MDQPPDPARPLAGITPQTQALLNDLHARSLAQEKAIPESTSQAIRAKYSHDPEAAKAEMDKLMLDKFIALDEDKCRFVHGLMLATGARTVVEVGTSFGVSTIYLAAAVAVNVKRLGGKGVVVATEKEAEKVVIARENWDRAGDEVREVIQLREGDLEQTLKVDIAVEGGDNNKQGMVVDFVLLDIWPYVALPALKLLMPRMRPGAVVVTDNIVQSAQGYKELIEVFSDPAGPFQTVTLPYDGGLEMSVYQPKD